MGEDTTIQVIDQWPAHPTWKRWLFRVWDKRTRDRVNRTFADGDKPAGWLWAEDQRSLLNLRLTSAGAVPFAAVGLRYVEDLEAVGRKPAYIAEVKRVYQAVVAAGAVDMRDEGFALKVRDWLVAAPCFYKSAQPAKPEGHRPVLENLEARLARAEKLLTTCTAKERPNYVRRLEHWRARVARAKARAQAKMRTPSAITKNRWLISLKSIGKCAVKHYGLTSNPLSAIKAFKQDRNIKTALRVDELRAMVADARQGDDYFRPACLMVYTGMRVDEAAHVRWDWFDREARTIHIAASIRDDHGRVIWVNKGNKARLAHMPDELAELIGRWSDDAAPAAGFAAGWVIGGGERLRKLEDKGHWLAFREYLGRCGIDAAARDLSPHCTRHTWTAIMLATGASPNRVRRWLGHAKLETTDLYADAEASFERVVREWPRAEMRLRATPTARPAAPAATAQPAGFVLDCAGDLGAFLREHLLRGTLDQVAATSGVPLPILKAWFVDGVPAAVQQYVAALGASAALAASGTAGASAPAARIAAPIAAIVAPLTSSAESR